MLRPILFASAGAVALAGFAAPANSQDNTQPPPSSQVGDGDGSGGGAATPASYQDNQSTSNWNGVYSGMSLGGGFGSPPVCTEAANVFGAAPIPRGTHYASAVSQTGCAPVDTAGVIGGAQIGYNFKLTNNLLVGLETDLNGLSQSGHGSFANGTPSDSVNFATYATVSSDKGVDWLGTLRGRVGWLATPTLLVYGSGGLIYGGTRGNTNSSPAWGIPNSRWTGSSGNLSATQVGWTAGGGVEWMFIRNWSVKLEYLYYDLGPATWANSPNSAFSPPPLGAFAATNVSTSSTRFTGNIVRVGLNFHFGSGAPPVFTPPVFAKY